MFFEATEAELDAKKQELQEHFQAEQVRIKPLLYISPSPSQFCFHPFSLCVSLPIARRFHQHSPSTFFMFFSLGDVEVPQFGARTPKQAVHKLKQS